jgi:RND superfamily putative drug exporter
VKSIVDNYVRFTRRWRWPLTGLWLVALVVAAVVSAPLPTLLSGGGWNVEGSQSESVEEALREGFVGRGPSTVTVVVHDRWYTADQPGFEPRVERVLEHVAAEPALQVRSRIGWAMLTGPARDAYVGKDERTAVEVLGLALADGDARRVLPEIQTRLTDNFAEQGLEVSLVGTAAFWGEVNHLSERGLLRAELLTLPLILLVLVLLFGGVVAALASLSVGITAILFSFAVLTMLARSYELSVFVQNTATMLGLGVGVDYSLFVIARFKEELAAGRTVDEAIATTMRTSGETVVFSGVTIVAAMSTLFLVPLGVIASIALGAVVVVAFAVLASVLVLPVVLALLGRRIAAGSVAPSRGAHRASRAQRWVSLAGRVMRRPGMFLAAGVVALLAVAAPAVGLQTFTPDASIVPASSPVRSGFDHMQSAFGAGSTAPIQVVVQAAEPPGDGSALMALHERLSRLDGAAEVRSALPLLAQLSPAQPLAALQAGGREALPADARTVVDHYVSVDARTFVFEVVPQGRAADAATQDLVAATRTAVAELEDDLTAVVGGETAQGVESNEVIQDSLPWVLLTMLGVIYVLLLLTFRSVLLPLKAIAMNLLSVGATFGILVLVFQQHVVGLIGSGDPAYIQNFVPLLLLTLLFSLSTDYEVFLLSRVREDYLRTGDNEGSVARGLATTAPLISGAALLMVVVFGAFALAGILPIKQLGLGMAIAIAIDATIVRLILVPATMRLMGGLNWWRPGVPRWAASAGGRGDLAHPAGVEVLNRLDDFFLRVHHKGPIVDDRLVDRPAAQEQYVESRRA